MSIIDMKNINQLLCIGAHCDDIEIGAGGTIMRLIKENPMLNIHWVILTGADPVRAEEAKQSAALFTDNCHNVQIEILGFKDAFLPSQSTELKHEFERLKHSFSPDLIFTHYSNDRHQDHRIAAELTWNTWRNHTILEYEILKWDGDLGQPNIFMPVSQKHVDSKVDNIYQIFKTQHGRQWFEKETFRSLMRVRGVECNAKYAEAFYARKVVW
ncbi:PIG-L deacetylase family protein [Paraglaciecola sp. L3A3]|uniref:PIG-L deacetylase family protein n=1 Tax=Paraglaciecola sp. L3A3 TaxID=2686358 RepID=UPI00131C56DF|nr:PIG-L deacetylase family protein [Paraglaciecola sp. L3A3]